jgi:hypothetical protein
VGPECRQRAMEGLVADTMTGALVAPAGSCVDHPRSLASICSSSTASACMAFRSCSDALACTWLLANDSPRSRLVVQPGQAGGRESAADPTDLHRGIAHLPSDLRAGQGLGHQQHGAGASDQAHRGGGRSLQALQFEAIRVRHTDGARDYDLQPEFTAVRPACIGAPD